LNAVLTTQEKAQLTADGLGIPLWITEEGKIVQNKPKRGGTRIDPSPKAKPIPHAAPTGGKSEAGTGS
jgi:hypothetical protein